MANLRGWQLVILVVLILLLFGSKKLPDAARSLGRSLRIFKAETKALVDEEDGDKGAQAELSSADATDGSGANPSATAAAAEATAAAPVEEPSSQQSGSPKSS